MDLAPLATEAKTSLPLGLLGLHLSPGLQALLAQLSGKLAHLLFPSVRVPLLPLSFPRFLGQAFLQLGHC
jgi:hypothetical protein